MRWKEAAESYVSTWFAHFQMVLMLGRAAKFPGYPSIPASPGSPMGLYHVGGVEAVTPLSLVLFDRFLTGYRPSVSGSGASGAGSASGASGAGGAGGARGGAGGTGGVGTSKTSFTGLVVDEKGSRAHGSCILTPS